MSHKWAVNLRLVNKYKHILSIAVCDVSTFVKGRLIQIAYKEMKNKALSFSFRHLASSLTSSLTCSHKMLRDVHARHPQSPSLSLRSMNDWFCFQMFPIVTPESRKVLLKCSWWCVWRKRERERKFYKKNRGGEKIKEKKCGKIANIYDRD